MKVEAQNWQLKHYLNCRLKNENITLPWLKVYEDWKRSLKIIKNNTYKKVPDCISSFCHELLSIDNTLEGSAILKSCEQWYDDFYERNSDLQLAERVQQLEKKHIEQNADGTSMSSTKEIASSPETVQPYGQEDQEMDDAEIDKIIVNKVSALLFSNLNLEEIWIKVMDQLKKDNLRVQSIESWTNVEWNRILNVSDYSQFIKSRKKLSKDKINDDVRQLLRDGTGRIVNHSLYSFLLFSKYTQLLWCPHCCLRREVNVLILKHREHDFIVKILGPIIGTLLEESDIGIFELNWIEKESRSVTSRKRKAVHEEYMDLTTSMKQMDLIVTSRSHKNELLPLEVGNTEGLMDYTKYRKDLTKLKIVMKNCLDTLRSKLHFKEADLEGVFTLRIQITGRYKLDNLLSSYDSSQNFYFFVEMATFLLPTTLSDMEDLLPSFFGNLMYRMTHTLLDQVKKVRGIAQRRLSTPSPPSSPLHNTANSPSYIKKQKADPFEILD
ncbi:33962_t:CDS:2, partial [Gigaspora margarita]